MRRATLSMLLLLFCALSVGAAEKHVAKTGNDTTGTGAVGAPYLTIDKAISVIAGGDTITIHVGTYAEADIGTTRTIPAGSNWSSPTTIRAAAGENVIIQPSSGSRVISIATAGDRYYSFEGLHCDGTNVSLDTVKVTSGAQRVRFVDCEIYCTTPHGAQGLLISGINGTDSHGACEATRCTIHDNGTTDQHHQIYISHNADNLVDSCILYNGPSHGVQIWSDNADANSNNIVKNTLAHNLDRGFGLYAGSGNVIYNCVTYSVTTGIYFRNDGGTLDAPAAYNNTISATVGIKVASVNSTAVLKNNYIRIEFTPSQDATNTASNGASSTMVTRNAGTGGVDPIFFDTLLVGDWIQMGTEARQFATITSHENATVTVAFTNAHSNVHWSYGAAIQDLASSTKSNNVIDPNSVAAFSNEAGHDYHLTSGSTDAIDQGTSISGIFTTDKDGVSRPQGAAWDIGAYEFSSGGATFTNKVSGKATISGKAKVQ